MKVLIVVLVLILIFCLVELGLYTQRSRYRTYWLEQSQLPIEVGDLQYIVIGDSAAQGIGASSASKGYVGLLKNAFQNSTGRKVHVINLSSSGATVQDIIDNQLPKFKKLNLPKDAIITLEIGANNVGPDFNAEKFESMMTQILDELPKQTVVADVPYFGLGIKRSRESNVIEANKILDKLIAQHQMRQIYLHNQTKKYGSWRDFAPDLFHPNNRGYRNWYKAFWSVLEPKMIY